MQQNNDQHKYGADMLLGLVMVATFGGWGILAAMVLTFCRHSPIVVSGLMELAGQARGETSALLAGPRARAMLPALDRLLPAPGDEAEEKTNERPEVAQNDAQQATEPATKQLTAASAGKEQQLAMIDIQMLARCSTILLVGSRGSGKTTLLRALLEAKKAQSFVAVYDPHAAPSDWPMAQLVHNSEDSISKGMASAYRKLQQRKDERRKGVRLEGWPKLTLAADEWGNIVANVELPEGLKKTPGQVSTELMKEGRKFGIGFVAGAHGLTNKSLGCEGDQEAFLQSFDWILHMGGYTRKLIAKEYPTQFAKLPLGTNDQGGTFPLIVACESPTTGEIRMLDMRGLVATVDTSSAKAELVPAWETATSAGTNSLLAGMLAESHRDMPEREESQCDMVVTASQSNVTYGDSVTVTTPTTEEMVYITMSLSQGMSIAAVARTMKGYNGRTRERLTAKVEYVKRLVEDATAQVATAEMDEGE